MLPGRLAVQVDLCLMGGAVKAQEYPGRPGPGGAGAGRGSVKRAGGCVNDAIEFTVAIALQSELTITDPTEAAYKGRYR